MADPKHVLGLDLGTHSVKVATLDGQSGEIVNIRIYPIVHDDAAETTEVATDDATTQVKRAPTEEEVAPDPEEQGSPSWVSVLASIVTDHDEKQIVVTNAPDGIVAAIHVDVPFSDREKVASVIPHLLSDELPIDAKKAVYDFYAYDQRDESSQAVVGFTTAEDLREFLAEVAGYGFDPATVTLPSLTLGNFAASLFTDSPDPIAVVDMGHSFSTIVVVDGGRPILARNNRAAGKKITAMLAERFSKTFQEAELLKHQFAAILEKDDGSPEMRVMSQTIREGLKPVVRDIRRSLQGLYANTGREVSTVYVCGGTSNIKNLERFMSSELGIPVRRLPVGVLSEPYARVGVMGYALARNYTDDKASKRTVNLRTGEFAYTGLGSPLRRMMVRFIFAAIAVLIVLGGVFYLEKLGHEARRDAMQKELGIVSKKVFGERVMSSSEVRKRFAGEESSEQFVPKVSAYELLHDVVAQISKDVELELTRMEVDLTRNVIQVVGKTTDAQAVDSLISDLREIECFKKVTPGKTKVKKGKAEFDLQISSGCS